jgi:pimeloyl-ACP methyl ester carboxylesterase
MCTVMNDSTRLRLAVSEGLLVRHCGRPDAPTIVLLAGFGDTGAMFVPLAGTVSLRRFHLVMPDLPGFGASPPRQSVMTLEQQARVVVRLVEDQHGSGAPDPLVLVGHSVASIIASLAARMLLVRGRQVQVMSLEGNLTAADAYFSGTAADHDDPVEFKAAFVERLRSLAVTDPIVDRYRSRVMAADPEALWRLGRDSRRVGDHSPPGAILESLSPAPVYLYNPDNCDDSSLRWLERSALRSVRMHGVSHWATIDAPDRVADELARVAARV